jgi:DNA invertase Pin-like site-specific DNA recombinase
MRKTPLDGIAITRHGEHMNAVGVVRQSSGRGKAEGASLADQERRIREHCKREGWKLLAVYHEQDVSGGRPLAKRPGMLEAVEAVEAGKADVVVAAYFDRLVRSVAVQSEIVQRVEAANGRVLALDVGEVKDASGTAAEWLTGQVLGLLAEHVRRRQTEHAKAMHARKREAGEWAGGKVPPGVCVVNKRLVRDEATAGYVRDAFDMREAGASHEAIRRYLKGAGLPVKSLIVVSRMLTNEVYIDLGIVPRSLFKRVQDGYRPRGPREASDRLLARLGVLRCASCGSRMVPHGAKSNQVYRCGGQECDRKMAVSCHIAEDAVVHAVRCALADREGRAGGDVVGHVEAKLTAKRAEQERIVFALTGMDNVAGVREKMAVLQGEVEALEDALEDARQAAAFTLRGGLDWPHMTRQAHRDLIRAAVAEAIVGPGKGAGRVRVTFADAFAPEPILDVEAVKVRDEIRSVLAEAV